MQSFFQTLESMIAGNRGNLSKCEVSNRFSGHIGTLYVSIIYPSLPLAAPRRSDSYCGA